MKLLIMLTGLLFNSHSNSLLAGHQLISFPACGMAILQDTTKKPIVLTERTIAPPMQVLLIRDTGSMASLSGLFGKDYGSLYNFIFSNGLKPGKPMAFYLNDKDPFIVEVAVEVDNIPQLLKGNIQAKKTNGGNAVVVHYTGPYEQIGIAYNAVTAWLKENNVKPSGFPYEIYLNDPTVVKDKYALKTDLYQLIQ